MILINISVLAVFVTLYALLYRDYIAECKARHEFFLKWYLSKNEIKDFDSIYKILEMYEGEPQDELDKQTLKDAALSIYEHWNDQKNHTANEG